ncbi:MAG TPA: ATP-binding protein [Candidatus Krumholzibacteria bacterium]|nr:ATP-binding protein [Candidatus Krumholzibacteria bacterium]
MRAAVTEPAESAADRERLQRVAAQLKTLYHMGRDLGGDENWSDALDRFLMALVSFLRADGAGLLLFSDQGRSLSARALFHLDDGLVGPAIDTIRDGWRAHTRGGEIHSLESYADARATSCLERAEPWRVTLIPIRHRGRGLGFLLLDKPYAGAADFQADYHFLSALQTIFAEEIANASYISELRQLSRFNNKVLDNIRSGVVTTDLTGKIRYANALAGEMCPRVRRAAARSATHLDELFRVPMGARGLFGQFIESGEDADVLEVECHGGAATFPARLRLTRMHDDLLNGTVVVGIFDDLSEHKRMEEAIRRNDRLRSLGQLAASVAHEIRNPLAGIATTAEVLGEKLRGDQGTVRHIQTMLDEISRLDGIVRNLLAFSRPPRPQLSACDVRDVLARVHGLVAEQAAARGVEIVNVAGVGDVICRGDASQLTQVLLNLALNAVQACGAGDRVAFAARSVAADGASWVEMEVADNGPGVPEEVRSSLFEPFVSTKAQGTGLGLAICRQIVGDHGGAIACEFLERGTRFFVRVPAMQDTTRGRHAPQPARSH